MSRVVSVFIFLGALLLVSDLSASIREQIKSREGSVCRKVTLPVPPFYQIRRFENNLNKMRVQNFKVNNNLKLRTQTSGVNHILTENIRNEKGWKIGLVLKDDMVVLKANSFVEQNIYDYTSFLLSREYLIHLSESTEEKNYVKPKNSSEGMFLPEHYLKGGAVMKFKNKVYDVIKKASSTITQSALIKQLKNTSRLKINVISRKKAYREAVFTGDNKFAFSGYVGTDSLFPLAHNFAYIKSNYNKPDTLLCPQVSLSSRDLPEYLKNLSDEQSSYAGLSFATEQCYTSSPYSNQFSSNDFTTNYYFDEYNWNNQKISYGQGVKINPKQDGRDLTPIHLDHAQGLLRVFKTMKSLYKGLMSEFKLSDFEMNYQGFISLPRIQIKDDPFNDGEAIDGSYFHYRNNDPDYSDAWGEPNTICGIMGVAKNWKQTCNQIYGQNSQACTLQVGDLAFINKSKGVGRKKKERDPIGHKTHESGYCVDLRPIVNKNRKGKANMIYSRDRSIKFIASMFQSHYKPSKLIYSKLGKSSYNKILRLLKNKKSRKAFEKAYVNLNEHPDHIHVCFEPPNPIKDRAPLCNTIKEKLCSKTLPCDLTKNSADQCLNMKF